MDEGRKRVLLIAAARNVRASIAYFALRVYLVNQLHQSVRSVLVGGLLTESPPPRAPFKLRPPSTH